MKLAGREKSGSGGGGGGDQVLSVCVLRLRPRQAYNRTRTCTHTLLHHCQPALSTVSYKVASLRVNLYP